MKTELEQTCWMCPEQYDFFIDSERAGYFRLRHGCFTVEYPDVGGELVYSAETNGDGAFETDERDQHLNAGIAACIERYKETHGTGI